MQANVANQNNKGNPIRKTKGNLYNLSLGIQHKTDITIRHKKDIMKPRRLSNATNLISREKSVMTQNRKMRETSKTSENSEINTSGNIDLKVTTNDEGSAFLSRTDCAAKIEKLMTEFENHQCKIKEKYDAFIESLPDFFFALKISKPLSLECYSKLSDVIKCHTYLKQSQSIGKSVQTELITEFLRIVNLIRVENEKLEKEITSVETHLLRYIPGDTMQDFKGISGRLLGVLDVEFDLLSLEPVDPSLLRGILERKLFTGLVAYLPALCTVEEEMMNMLQEMCKILNLEIKVDLDGGGEVKDGEAE